MQWCVCQTNIEISSNSALAVETVVSKKQCWLTVRKCTQTKTNSFTTKLSKVEQKREVAPNKRSDYSSPSHLFDACPVVKGHLGITNSVSAFVILTPPEAQHICLLSVSYIILVFVSLLQQTDCHVSGRSRRGGAVSLPHLEGVLWSLAFPLFCHPH